MPRVPDRDREHAAERLDERRAALFIQVDEDLGVAVGGEGVTASAELVHQLPVVVDLAVLDHLDPPVLVRDRLVAAREVDDR